MTASDAHCAPTPARDFDGIALATAAARWGLAAFLQHRRLPNGTSQWVGRVFRSAALSHEQSEALLHTFCERSGLREEHST